MKASVSKKATEKKEKKKVKLPEIKGYVGVYESPSNEQLEMLEEAINKSFKLYFKEDPTGTSKILYHGIPVVPIDKSGNLDLSDFLTKIILAYAGI